MRGRKPKPLEQRIAEGNPGRRPLPEPIVYEKPTEPPAPPEHLNDDGQRFWGEAIPQLHKLGILDTVDAPALEMAAVAYQRFHQARRLIKQQGLLMRMKNGELKENPAVESERRAQAQFLRFAEQYGLTSVARARLGIAILQGRSLEHELAADLGETKLTPA